jgi:hypothetical protein
MGQSYVELYQSEQLFEKPKTITLNRVSPAEPLREKKKEKSKKKERKLSSLEEFLALFTAFTEVDSEALRCLIHSRTARIMEDIRHRRFMSKQDKIMREVEAIALELGIQ